jgi:hypothetical protein
MADSARGSPTGRNNAKKTTRKRPSLQNVAKSVIGSLGNLSRRARSGSRGSRGSRGNRNGAAAGALPASLEVVPEDSDELNGFGGEAWGGENNGAGVGFRPINGVAAPSRPASMRLNEFLGSPVAAPNRSESRGAAAMSPIVPPLEDKIARIESFLLLSKKKRGGFSLKQIDEKFIFPMIALRVAKTKIRNDIFGDRYAPRIPGLEDVERVAEENESTLSRLRLADRIAGRVGFQTRRARNLNRARSESRRRREESEARQRAVDKQAERMRTLLSLLSVELVWAHVANPTKTMIQLQNDLFAQDKSLMNIFYVVDGPEEEAAATFLKEIKKDAAREFYKRQYEIRMQIEEPMHEMFTQILIILNRGVEDPEATVLYDRILAAQTEYNEYINLKYKKIYNSYSREEIDMFYDAILNWEKLIEERKLVEV